jgi:diguanylate cyclase (GGDEF)-like protein
VLKDRTLHTLLSAQIREATRNSGDLDLAHLLALIDAAYGARDQEQRQCTQTIARFAGRLAQAAREQQQLVGALEDQTLRSKLALDHMSQGLGFFDADKRLLLSNRRYAEIYGLSADQIRPGMSLREILELRATAGCDPKMSYDEYTDFVPSRDSVNSPTGMVVELNNGRSVAIRHWVMANGGYVATHEDITERRAAETRIAHMAHHDALTGLPNRVLFKERLQHELANLGPGQSCVLLYLDLDDFKTINDTLGHPLGDALLSVVTQRLRRSARQNDTVARLGGDEFAILQAGLRDSGNAMDMAERVVADISAPYNLEGHQVVIRTSIGIARAPNDGTDPDQLMKNADLAMYSAKVEGKARYCFFRPEMAVLMEQRRALELELRMALAADEFTVFYQPFVSVPTGRISGFEALLRWNSPRRGLVCASEFILLAEEIGLTVQIGELVLNQACAEAASWPDELRVSINVFAGQLKSGTLVAAVTAALGSCALPASRLELEITETAMIQDPGAARAVLRQLKGFGISIALDDFGAGYSSLSYLRDFPFDRIKIDRSFVRDLNRPDSISIVRAMTGLCSSLGMATTAEGVETNAQLDILRAEQCDEVQGFLFGAPCPAREIPALLRTFAKTRVARTKRTGILAEVRACA